MKSSKCPPTPVGKTSTAPLLWACIFAGLFSLAINLLVLTSPIYMFQVFDRVLGTGHLDTLIWLTAIAAGAYLTFGALEAVRGHILSRAGIWLDRVMAGRLIDAGLAAGLVGEPTGSQPLRDLAQFRSFLSGPAMSPLLDAPWTPVFIAVLWFMHPWLGNFAIAMAGLLLIVMLAGEALTRRPTRKGDGHQTQAHLMAEGVLRNGETVQAMGLLPALLARWSSVQDAALTAHQKASDRALRLQGFSKAARMFMQTAILGIGAWLVVKGELTAGGMIAASILLGRALAPVDQLLGSWRQFISVRAAWKRVRGLLGRHGVGEASMPLPAPVGVLSVEEMTYAVPGMDRPLLAGISFTVPAGASVGIVGPSGAGKSTLCRLLVGALRPTSGHVRLDHADLADWNRPEVGPHLGYLPQEVALFAGTVGENIARMGEADPEKVVAAAQLADIHEMILRLPQGYETRVDDGSLKLSGGQRQRIGLARALYGEPKLLILDEPNAHLDGDGEAALVAALAVAKQRGCTVIMVNHRPALLAAADLLLYLRDGTVQAFGPTREIWPMLTGQPPQAVSNLARAAAASR